jgi:hypothetical protein
MFSDDIIMSEDVKIHEISLTSKMNLKADSSEFWDDNKLILFSTR